MKAERKTEIVFWSKKIADYVDRYRSRKSNLNTDKYWYMQKFYSELIKVYANNPKMNIKKYEDFESNYFKFELFMMENNKDFSLRIIASSLSDDFWRNCILIQTSKNLPCRSWDINNRNYTKLVKLCQKFVSDYEANCSELNEQLKKLSFSE